MINDDHDKFNRLKLLTFRKRIQLMEQQLSNLTAAIMNSDLNLHKSGNRLFASGYNICCFTSTVMQCISFFYTTLLLSS